MRHIDERARRKTRGNVLSNWIANYALDRSNAWMDRHDLAVKRGEDRMAERALRKAENWDDVRYWIDGESTWHSLRAARAGTREYRARQSRPLAIVDVEGVAS